jgi:hypothetical protein
MACSFNFSTVFFKEIKSNLFFVFHNLSIIVLRKFWVTQGYQYFSALISFWFFMVLTLHFMSRYSLTYIFYACDECEWFYGGSVLYNFCLWMSNCSATFIENTVLSPLDCLESLSKINWPHYCEGWLHHTTDLHKWIYQYSIILVNVRLH